jgi:hypothetical protein
MAVRQTAVECSISLRTTLPPIPLVQRAHQGPDEQLPI